MKTPTSKIGMSDKEIEAYLNEFRTDWSKFKSNLKSGEPVPEMVPLARSDKFKRHCELYLEDRAREAQEEAAIDQARNWVEEAGAELESN